MLALALALPLLLAACGPASDTGAPDTGGALPAELGACPDGSALAWAEVAPIFGQHCTGCHSAALDTEARQGAPAPINYDTPEAAIVGAFVTWQSIVSGAMPPAGQPLPAAEARQVWEWLSCGGPQ